MNGQASRWACRVAQFAGCLAKRASWQARWMAASQTEGTRRRSAVSATGRCTRTGPSEQHGHRADATDGQAEHFAPSRRRQNRRARRGAAGRSNGQSREPPKQTSKRGHWPTGGQGATRPGGLSLTYHARTCSVPTKTAMMMIIVSTWLTLPDCIVPSAHCLLMRLYAMLHNLLMAGCSPFRRRKGGSDVFGRANPTVASHCVASWRLCRAPPATWIG